MTNMTTDEELIQRIAQGDSKAFESLLGRYQKNVFGLCRKLMRSDMLAEEIAQETWMRVVCASSQFETNGSVKSWILTIAKNLCLNALEKRGWEEALPEGAEEQIQDPGEELEAWLSSQQEKRKLTRALDHLPDRQRAALILWMQEEKTYEELAREMKTNVGAMKVLLFRAKENLAKIFQELDQKEVIS